MTAKALARIWLLLCLLAVLAGCASRPDLARLYENSSSDPQQPPVIIIHGLAGSTLVDIHTGKQMWPGSLSTLTFSNYRDLAQMSAEDREGEGLVPGDLFYSVAGVDFYGALLHSLETVGRFKRGVPGQAVGAERRRYYVLLYDWRKDNMLAVRKLHALINQIRLDYGDPNLRVDIIAHSNGGVIANYYLRYGPTDVLEQAHFTPWHEGDLRVRRLMMLGTPALGAVTSLERLIYGTRLALRTVPVEVMATFATPFQALPHPLVKSILDPQGRPVDLDIYDPQVWRDRHWSVFSPEVIARVRGSMATPAEADRAVAQLQDTFVHHQHRAERLQWALSAPVPTRAVEVAVFGGDCEQTPAHAVLLQDGAGSRLVFRAGQVDPNRPGAPHKKRRDRPDYERLMFEPGDGLVTRSSQLARRPAGVDPGRDDFHMLPTTQTFLLCESHGRLTHNPYFQNNLLYFLLSS
jgi:pimeloyl-ACP methyl ester carboxylesterase